MPRQHKMIVLEILIFLIISSTVSCAISSDFRTFWGVALDGYPITAATISIKTEEMPVTAQLVAFYLQWPCAGSDGDFPANSLDAIWHSGALPCITWEPFCIQNGSEKTIPHSEILRGTYDRYLLKFASASASWGNPLIIRFAHEMNIERYHWGTTREDYGPASPEIYRKMFRYVVKMFQAAGADNVLWAFCPNAESVPNVGYEPSAGWNRVSNYYPGDDVVDILGMDGYNWGTTQTLEENGWQSKWRSFKNIFQELYTELRSLSALKPIIVFETSSAVQGGDKAGWLYETIEVIREWNLEGLVWFQVQKEIDWRFETGLAADFKVMDLKEDFAREWAQRYLDERRRKP